MCDIQLQTAPVSQSIRTFARSIPPVMCACNAPVFPRDFPYPTGGVRRPVPLLLGRRCSVVLGATSSEMSGTFTLITHRKCGGTITVPMGPTTVRTLNVLSVAGWVLAGVVVVAGCCGGGFRWPFQATSSASSSCWSSASSSSAVALTRVVLILLGKVRGRAGGRGRHGVRSVVDRLRWMSIVLLLHVDEHGANFGHVRA